MKFSEDDRSSEIPIINRPFRFWKGSTQDLTEILEQRELLFALVRREIRQRYKGSFLGWGWALIRPIVMLAIYGLAIGVFLGANRSLPQYALYVYSGLILFGLFAAIVSGCISVIPANAGLIKKASFRRELLFVPVAVVALLDFMLQSTILIIGYWVYGEWPTLAHLLWLLPSVVLIVLLALALGMLLAASNVRYRDVGYLVDIAIQVFFWLVPIVYTLEMVGQHLRDFPFLLTVYSMNPVVVSVDGARMALWPGAYSEVGAPQVLDVASLRFGLGVGILLSLPLLWLGQRVFSRGSGNLAQEL